MIELYKNKMSTGSFRRDWKPEDKHGREPAKRRRTTKGSRGH